MVTLCMFARLEASEMENEARVDQSREPCRNFPLILCRQSANRKLVCPSELCHQTRYFQQLKEGKRHKAQQLFLGVCR